MDKNQLPPLPEEMQAAVDTPQEAQEEVQEAAAQQEQKESDSARNFRALREAKERAERERDEALRIITQVQTHKNNASLEEEDDSDININPENLNELKPLEKKIKKLENQIKQYQSQSTVAATEARIKAQYPDFDNVVSQNNLAQLSSQYPEIANAIGTSSDLYSQAVSAYTIIKKLGISAEDDTYAKDREREKVNAAKPRPLASVSPQQGESPLSRANAFAEGLTEDLKKQLHREMISAMKNQ